MTTPWCIKLNKMTTDSDVVAERYIGQLIDGGQTFGLINWHFIENIVAQQFD